LKFLSGKINDLLGLPLRLSPGEFYSIQDGATSKLYFCDARGNLLLLSNDSLSSGNFIIGEVPLGAQDGINDVFNLEHIPIAGSLQVYLNGLRLNIVDDYTVTGNELTMLFIPIPEDTFTADYRY
jgi:hypothetical protein